MGKKYRARSMSAKAERENTILAAAERLLRQTGYNEVTMQGVASEAGLAKGTIYLYFTNREALILGVNGVLFDRWVGRLASCSSNLLSFDGFCEGFAQNYAEDTLFMSLTCVSESYLQQGLDQETYIKVRRAKARRVKKLAGLACMCLGVSPEQAQKLVWGFLTIAAGAAQMSGQKAVDHAILPHDVNTFNAFSDFHSIFLNAARPLVTILK
jgi:AcrR family transcriptional regulator